MTPEGAALPPNTLDEIRRDLARLAVVREEIEAIERDRLARLQQAPQSRSNAMVVLLARVVGVGLETADMLVQEVLCAAAAGSQGRRTLRRPDRLARRERAPASRKGPGKVRQRPRAPRPDPVGLAVPDVPEGSGLAAWYRLRTEGRRPGARR